VLPINVKHNDQTKLFFLVNDQTNMTYRFKYYGMNKI